MKVPFESQLKIYRKALFQKNNKNISTSEWEKA